MPPQGAPEPGDDRFKPLRGPEVPNGDRGFTIALVTGVKGEGQETRSFDVQFPNVCGIVGYLGSRDGRQIVIDGLRRLEYRGYDSAGIAVVAGGELYTRMYRSGRALRPRSVRTKGAMETKLRPK